jgi:DNA modification methylase
LSDISIFDPVLTELLVAWFSPATGRVLDPFAGGSVRGIVAAMLGRDYTGVDLRAEQVQANEAQWKNISANTTRQPIGVPTWLVGDSMEVLAAGNGDAGNDYDMLLTCPPYGDLEVYSDDPHDLSTMDGDAFLATYRAIIAAAVERLRADSFAAIVVGDYRNKKGLYRNFVSNTIAAFEDSGARLYNEAILVTCVGTLPIRVGRMFDSSRKLGKTHQNVLVFVKGDPKAAAAACGSVVRARFSGMED